MTGDDAASPLEVVERLRKQYRPLPLAAGTDATGSLSVTVGADGSLADLTVKNLVELPTADDVGRAILEAVLDARRTQMDHWANEESHPSEDTLAVPSQVTDFAAYEFPREDAATLVSDLNAMLAQTRESIDEFLQDPVAHARAVGEAEGVRVVLTFAGQLEHVEVDAEWYAHANGWDVERAFPEAYARAREAQSATPFGGMAHVDLAWHLGLKKKDLS